MTLIFAKKSGMVANLRFETEPKNNNGVYYTEVFDENNNKLDSFNHLKLADRISWYKAYQLGFDYAEQWNNPKEIPNSEILRERKGLLLITEIKHIMKIMK